MDYLKNTVRSSFFGFFSHIISIVSAFAVRTILIYKLGVEYVGLNGLFVSVFNLLSLSELGIGSAISYSMYRPIAQKNNELICALLFFYKKVYRIIGMVIFVLGLFVLPCLRFIVSADVPSDINIYVLYLILLVNTVSSYFFNSYKTVLFVAHQRNDIKSKIDILVSICISVSQIMILLFSKNYYFYVFVLLLSVLPKNLLINKAVKKFFPKIIPTAMPDRKITKGIFQKITPLLGHKIGATFLVSIDSIVISSFLGLKPLGVYNNYYYIITSIIGITSIVQQSLLAGIGNKIVFETPQKIFDLYSKCSFVWHWIVGACSICLVCLFQDFIKLWVGDNNLLPIRDMFLIALYYYSWQFRVIGLTFKDAAGLWKDDWIKPYIGMIINFTFSIILVNITNSIIGVLIPTIVVFLFIYFPLEIKVICNKLFECKSRKVLIPEIAYGFVIFVLGAATFLICDIIGDINGYISLILKGVISFVIPNTAMIIIYRNTEEYHYIKSLLLRHKKPCVFKGGK